MRFWKEKLWSGKDAEVVLSPKSNSMSRLVASIGRRTNGETDLERSFCSAVALS